MIVYLKRQWLRLKESWKAFKREWKYNYLDSDSHIGKGRPFQIMGLNVLIYGDDDKDFRLNPPYYGQALQRIDGHVFTLKYKHYNERTGVVRYFDTDKPETGFVVITKEYLDEPELPNAG